MAIEETKLYIMPPSDLSGRMSEEQAKQMCPLILQYLKDNPNVVTNRLGNYVREVISIDLGKVYFEFQSGFKGIPDNIQVIVTLDRNTEAAEAYDRTLGNYMGRNYG